MQGLPSRRDDDGIVGWQSDPNGRGTMGLIWSCVLTLTLCVWSALHLNIPPKHDSVSQYWFRVLRWVLLGVFCPELVLWAAWRQWGSANLLTAQIEEALGDDNGRAEGQETGLKRKNSRHHRRHKWTRLHSFYVCMGGLVFDTAESDEEEMTFIPKHRRLTLSPMAAILLAKCGHLPDLDPGDIKDKSKADSLAKVLVLTQATWFLVQTIARLVQKLPVSLLEVNTIAHVLCALIVYLLWWHKPREVKEPTIVRGEWTKSMCSYMFMASRVSGVQYRRGIRPSAWISPELENLLYITPDGAKLKRAGTDITIQSSSADEITQSPPIPASMGEFGELITEIRRQETEFTAARKRKLGWEVDDNTDDTTSLRLIRHSFCAKAFHDYPAVQEYFVRKTPTSRGYVPTLEQFVVPVAINWPSDFLMPTLPGQVVGMVLWFVSIMYGGVHLAAWNEFFPSQTERLLWHMAAGFIAASGVWWTVAHTLFLIWAWLDDWWDRFVKLKNYWLQYVVYGFLMSCAMTVYILSRIYLSIEGIVSLRSAPVKVFDTVDWSLFIPHF